MFPGHRVPQSKLSHLARPQGSTIKPQSCCQATGYNHQTSFMYPGNRVPESNQCHVPTPRDSNIRPQSCSQCTGFHHQTSVMLPVHRLLRSNHSQVPRPQGSRIKPQSCCQATGYHHQTSIMINSKWMKDLNVRPDTIKLLEENISRTLYGINHSKILFDPPPREMKIKINKWNLMKLKSFCTAKNP